MCYAKGVEQLVPRCDRKRIKFKDQMVSIHDAAEQIFHHPETVKDYEVQPEDRILLKNKIKVLWQKRTQKPNPQHLKTKHLVSDSEVAMIYDPNSVEILAKKDENKPGVISMFAYTLITVMYAIATYYMRANMFAIPLFMHLITWRLRLGKKETPNCVISGIMYGALKDQLMVNKYCIERIRAREYFEKCLQEVANGVYDKSGEYAAMIRTFVIALASENVLYMQQTLFFIPKFTFSGEESLRACFTGKAIVLPCGDVFIKKKQLLSEDERMEILSLRTRVKTTSRLKVINVKIKTQNNVEFNGNVYTFYDSATTFDEMNKVAKRLREKELLEQDKFLETALECFQWKTPPAPSI